MSILPDHSKELEKTASGPTRTADVVGTVPTIGDLRVGEIKKLGTCRSDGILLS